MNNLLLKEYFLKNTLKISSNNIYLDIRYIYIKNVFK